MKSKKVEQILSVAGILAGILLLYGIAKNINDVETLISKAGVAGPAVAILLYGLFAPTPVSTDAITIVCGGMYGPVYGTAIAWMGNNIAALVEYYIGKHIGESTDFEREKKKLPLGLDKLPVNSILVLTLGRMIPFYGSKIISIMAGMYKVPIKRYIWTSALINFTGAITLAYGGFKALDLLKSLF